MNRILQVVLTGNNTGLKSVLAQSAAEVKAYGRSVEAANKTAAASGAAVGTSLRAVAMGAGVAAVGLGYAVLKAAQFETAMRNVNTLAGLTEGGFRSLSNEVIAMSTRLPQSAEVLAEGLYDVIGSGFEAADALTVLDAAAQAASAGMTTTQISAKAIGAVLNAYGREAGDAADVSDVLFQTVNLGVLSFDELAGSIGDVVGTAAAAKVEIDEIGAAIAAMTLTGINGGEATTSLNNLITDLIQPSEALSDAFSDLGYQSGAQALEQDGLRGVMEKLRGAYGDNVTALLELFPNIRSARGALALMADEGRNYARVSDELTEKEQRQGATARVLAEQLKGTAAQLQLLKNQAEGAAILLGTKLLPAAQWVIEMLRASGSAIADVASDVGDRLAPAWAALADVGADVVDVLEAGWDLIGPFVVGLLKIGGGVVIYGINAVATALGAVSGFLAENEAAAIALSIVLLARLIPSVGLARVALWRFVGTPVVLFLAGILGGAQAVSTFFTGGFTAAAATARTALLTLMRTAGPLMVVAGVVAAIMEIQRINGIADDARDSIETLMKPVEGAETNVARIGALTAAIDGLREKMAETKAEMQDKSWLDELSDSTKIPGLDLEMPEGFTTPKDWLFDDTDEQQEALEEYQRALDEARESKARMSEATAILADQFDIDKDQVTELADKYGIDLSGSINDSIRMFENYQAMELTDTKKIKTQELIDALGVLADEGSNAAEKIDALKTALDMLGGKEVSVFEATASLQQEIMKSVDAIEGMSGAVLTADGHLNAYSEAGIAAGNVLVGVRDKGNDLISTMIEQGATFEEVQKANNDLRDGFLESAANMGITGAAAEALADEILGVPTDRETRFKAAMGTTPDQIAALQRQIDGLKDKTITIGTRTVHLDPDPGNGGRWTTGGPAARTGGIQNLRLHSFADGGTFGLGLTDSLTGGRLPTTAGVARDGANLVQWAESGTGGEAFVPLGNRYAPKSRDLVRWLHSYFFPEDVQAFAFGGTLGTPSGYTASVPPSPSSAPAINPTILANVRVMLGTREITDIVRVEATTVVDKRDADLARNIRSAR